MAYNRSMTTQKILAFTLLTLTVGLTLGFGVTTLGLGQASAHSVQLAARPVFGELGFADPVVPLTVAHHSEGVGGSFVTDVYNAVSPAVVHITNRSVHTRMNFWSGPQEYISEATGSGVIVDGNGYILTNDHVIAGAETILVVLNDGREFEAEIIGTDPGTDLALIKIEAGGRLPIAAMGDSDAVEVGEWVVAIGNPRGLDWTVTAGVVSALGRETVSQRTGLSIRGLIQTDATINPGNSGGPLLNTQGEIIGINEMILSTSGGSQGIGLAIPINLAKDILEDLITYGRVIRPWLGVELYLEIDHRSALRFRLPVDYGVVIGLVYKDSPAALGGLEPYFREQKRGGNYQYDIVLAVDGEHLDEERELLNIIREHEIGDTVVLDIYRVTNGQIEELKLEMLLEGLHEGVKLFGII